MIPLGSYWDKPLERADAPEDEVKAIERSVAHDYELDEPNSARALQEAEENNLQVVFPGEDELLIDIDSNRALDVYHAMKPLLERYYGVKDEEITVSRSGLPKRHITVKLFRTLGIEERILLQVLMGSDRVREFLSLVQANNADPHPTLFLEKKPEVPTVVEEKTDAGSTLPSVSGTGDTY